MDVQKALEAELADAEDRVGRAEICEKYVRVIYEYVKFQKPEGGGLDGRAGPERRALALVLDAAINAKLEALSEKHS